MHLLEPGSGYATLEDAIVLLGVNVERLLVNGRVVLDLIDRGIGVSLVLRMWILLLGLLLDEEVMRGIWNGSGYGGGVTWRWLPGVMSRGRMVGVEVVDVVLRVS